jgi:hypothetical protein
VCARAAQVAKAAHDGLKATLMDRIDAGKSLGRDRYLPPGGRSGPGANNLATHKHGRREDVISAGNNEIAMFEIESSGGAPFPIPQLWVIHR